MPFARIEVPQGTPDDYRLKVGRSIQRALHAALGVPMEECFQVITGHGAAGLVIDPGYLGIARSSDAIIVQVYLNSGRDAHLKQTFFRAAADELHDAVALRRQDLVISLVEVEKDDWSFGNGEAQLVTATHG